MSLFVVRGSDPGTYPGSVHVRTLRRYQHPNLELEVTARVADVDGFLTRRSPDPHVLHVQRNAIDPSSVDDVIAACGERDVPLVVDLDDNLLDLHQLPTDDNQWREAAPSLQRLVAAADLVTVSTGPLRDAVKRYAEDVIVVPNHLDGTLWLDRLEDRPVQSDGVRVLYMGTPTHEEDLALLRSVITRFDVELNIPLKLEIIGGERPGYGQDWYTRVPVPSGTSHYPRFVRWLRSEAGRWDMAVAPLAGTEFNQYKSDLKFLEYSALGLPGVYSAVPAYASSVRDGSTGLLVENTTERWFEAVRGLATDWVLRSRIRQEAWSYVAEERTLERHADHLMDILRATARREELHNAAA